MAKKVTETKEQKKAAKVIEPKKLKVKVPPETKEKSEAKSPATKGKAVTDLTIEKAGSKVSAKSKTIAKSPA